MAHDVFVSFSSEEADIAMSVATGLEKKDLKCWISSRDIPAGSDYAEQIMYGINNCRIMVLILSSNTIKSQHVIRELDRAVDKKIQIVPFRIEDVQLTEAMEYYVGPAHWLDALTPDLEIHIEELAVHIQKIFDKRKSDKINKSLSSAKKLFADKNYIEARKHFKIVKEIDNENKDANYYLNEIDKLEREKAKLIANGIAFCKEAIDAQNPNQARVYINNVLELDKNNAEALLLQKEVQTLERNRQKIISQGIEAGKKALRSEHYNQAIKHFKEVFELDRNNKEVHDLLNKCERLEKEKQARITELLNLGKETFEAENYKLSIEHFRNVLELDKENRDALSYLTRIDQLEKKRRLKIAETLTLAKGLLKSNYKNKAKELFQEVLKLNSKNKEALLALKEIQLSEISSIAKKSKLNLKMVSIGAGLFVIAAAISVYFIMAPKPIIPQAEDKDTPITVAAPHYKEKATTPEKDSKKDKQDISEPLNEAPEKKKEEALLKPPEASETQVAELSSLARDAEAKGNYLKARDYYIDILRIDKNNKDALEKKESIDQHLKEKEKYLLLTGNKYLTDKNMKEAKRQYLAVLDLNSENKKAKKELSKISGIEKQIAFFNVAGKKALDNEDYNEAELNYKKVLGLEPKNKEALKGLKEVRRLVRPAEIKPLAVILKNEKLEFLTESDKRLNFGAIYENETINKIIKFQSDLNKKIQFGLYACNWDNKQKPLDMKPIELFDSQLLTLKPNESAKLQISLTMPEGTELPGGQYTGELLFKDLNSEYDYKISFLFIFKP